jgi:membrane protease YdiL (CAAX protease family)
MRGLRSLAVFFPVAFVLSWYPYILGKMHLVRTSGGINPLGPAVAALIVAAVFYGRRGIKELLSRYLPWRARWSDYAAAVLLPVLLVGAAGVLNVLLGAAPPSAAQLLSWPDLLPRFVFIFLFIGLGEETGWRGFALPELQKRFSPLLASLVIGVFWAAWHIPLIGVEFKGAVIPAFLLSVPAGSVVMAWLFNRANGALLPLPLMHATVNTVGAGYVFAMFSGADNIRLWWIDTALWMVVAIAAVIISPNMRRAPEGESSSSRQPLPDVASRQSAAG